MKLSTSRIRFVRGRKSPTRLTDGGGLSLEVRPSGRCLWRYRYRIAGKENVFAIGSFPELSLKQAREARDAARELVSQGIHPAHQRRRELRKAREDASKFEAIAREWLEEKRGGWSPRTGEQRARLLETDILPELGHLSIGQINAQHCAVVLKRIEARAPQVAVVARQAIGAISRFAIETGRSERDLTYPLHRTVATPRRSRTPQLAADELSAFFDALEGYPGDAAVQVAVRVLWLTLARPGDVIRARWKDIDFVEGTWSARGAGTVVLPLSSQALGLLGAYRLDCDDRSDYLFPNRKTLSRPADESILSKAFVALGYRGRLSPSGVSATAKKILRDAGYSTDPLERAESGDEEQRRYLVQAWGELLGSLSGRFADLERLPDIM